MDRCFEAHENYKKYKNMGLLNRLFSKNNESESIGDQACNIVLDYLESSKEYRLNPYTFIELFGFVYLEIDYSLYGHEVYSSDQIAKMLAQSYLLTMDRKFNKRDTKSLLELLDKRVQEYGRMIYDGKEHSEVVKKMEFYLGHASGLNEHYNEELPVFLRDISSVIKGTSELSVFYTESLVPLIRNIATKYK